MKRAWPAAGLLCGFLLLAAHAGAQSLTVSYIEGTASQRSAAAGEWSALSIGDEVPLDAAVKLEKLALVSFRAAGASITLTQPGTYVLRKLVAASASLKSAGAVQAAAIAFSRVLKGSGKRVDAVGGVRSEVMPPEDYQGIIGPESPGFDEPPADTAAEGTPAGRLMRAARGLIAEGNPQEAIDQLQAAIPAASEQEAREARFLLASALELTGDVPAAMEALQAAAPRGDEEWAPDSILLGARLLEDSFAWAPARDLLLKAGAFFADDDQRAPTYLFLLALAYRGTGEKDKQDLLLDRVFSLDPASELGQAAWKLRQAP